MIDYQTLCQAIEYWKQGGAPNAGVAEEVVEEVDSGLVQADELEEAHGEGDDAMEGDEQESVDSSESMDSGEHAVESDGDSEAESSDDESYDSDDR